MHVQGGVKTRRGTFNDPDRSFGRESRSLKAAYELYEVSHLIQLCWMSARKPRWLGGYDLWRALVPRWRGRPDLHPRMFAGGLQEHIAP